MNCKNHLRPYFVCAFAFVLLVCGNAFAAELKVDINNSGRPLSEGLDTAYTPWSTNQTWFSGGDTASATFDGGVTVTFTRTGTVGVALQPGYWKAGVQSTAYNVKLTADGIKVNTGDTGAQIEMRISGLPAGNHTLLTYHNVWDNLAASTVAPLDVFLNGTQVINNLPMSIQVTNNDVAATAYLNFTAVAGQDVVVLFQADTSGSQTTKNVYVNGFEIDTPNSKLQANSPSPADADEHANADSHSLTLSWAEATSGAISHDVYFGTNSSAVTAATHGSAEFKGNQTATSYAVSGLNSHLTYYWRVDEIGSSGTVTAGDVWYFRPRQLAFPGAEGYGRFARGGRGGVVREVTNLNDSGAGSLRDAIEGNYGPRTVVFTVSGLITLNSDITIDSSEPYMTVAGQTAPGKGICVRNYQFCMSGARDVICRDMRSRPGDLTGLTMNGSGMAGVDNVIMDHCSISWGKDEEMSTRGAKNLTFQRSFISEPLNIAGHQNYPPGTAHGYAATIGGNVGSFHHNLIAHSEGRNWSLGGGLDASGFYAGNLDIFDNVIYNWGSRTTDGGAHAVNFVNNYYKPGAASSIFTALNPQYGGFPGTQQYYMAGNVMPGHFQASNQSAGLSIGTESGGTLPQNSNPPYSATVSSPFFSSFATIDEVTNAYKKVLSDVGCNQPQIDDHDARVIRETIDGTFTYTGQGPYGGLPGLPNSQADVGGWENYGTTTRPANYDSDHDGLPDWWEAIIGTNPHSAAGDFSDANADRAGDGYSELDRYINWMAAAHVDCTTAVDVDLTSLSRGFTNDVPVYTVFNATNGTVTLTGGKTAHFVAGSTNQLGSFTFSVRDAHGYKMTNTVGVHVVAGVSAPPAPTSLFAVAGNAQAILTWVQSTGGSITQNKIYRSTNGSGGPYNLLVTLSATTSYTNTGLVNGSTYFYVVTAVNANGESAFSSYIGAAPQVSVPSAPTGLTASAGSAQVSLSWTASSGATSYRVKRATTSGGPYVNIVTNTTTSYTNTSLINGTTYYFVVSAVNASGESANSSQASATPSATVMVAYEGFSYSAGSRVNARSGGSGWGLNWSSTTNPADAGTNVAASLSYGSQVTTGGSVVFGASPSGSLVYTRKLAATLGTSAGTNHVIWASLLYLNKSTDTNAEARIGFYSGMGADATGTNTTTVSTGTVQVVDVGRAASGNDVISLYNGATINSSGVATPRGANAAYLLLEFVLNGTSANDQVYLWVNPNLALGAPAIGTQQASWTTADLDAINGLRFQTPAITGKVDIDEIRIGKTFANVTAAP